LEAAARLQAESTNALFLLVGEGAEKERIQGLAQSRNLGNVRFMDQQPREDIPALISASDACLVLLKKSSIFRTVIPTKMLEFMSCARPVILAVEGQAQQIVEAAGCGLVIEPENAEALAAAIHRLAADPEFGNALGQRGRNYILRNFSRAATAEHYARLMEGMLEAAPRSQP
jgi:glycosyltransferase involved in cell wall biosynthesis